LTRTDPFPIYCGDVERQDNSNADAIDKSTTLEKQTMVTFIILLNVKSDRINEIAEQLADMSTISEVYSVTGNYDLVVIVRSRSNDDVADLVANHIGKIDGIEQTDTMLAFKAFSRHDLESMFSI
jgi:DNA-binding Lrp family transcriptional regulator